MSIRHALIVDDNLLNIDVLTTLLDKAGLRAISVDVPRQLPDILSILPPIEVVFLDLEFPDYTGFELLKELRAIPQLAETPIIAYSVHTSDLDSVRQAGFDGFLGKPLNAQLFPDYLRRILDGESVWEV